MNKFYEQTEYLHNMPLITASKIITDFCENNDDILYIRNNSKIANLISKISKNKVEVNDASDANVSVRLSTIIDDLNSLSKNSYDTYDVMKLYLEKSCIDALSLKEIIMKLMKIIEHGTVPLNEFILNEAIPFKIDDYEKTYIDDEVPKTKYFSITWNAFMNACIDENYKSACKNLSSFIDALGIDSKFKDICCEYIFKCKYSDDSNITDKYDVCKTPSVSLKKYDDNIMNIIKNISIESISDKLNEYTDMFVKQSQVSFNIPTPYILQFMAESEYKEFGQVHFYDNHNILHLRTVVENDGKLYLVACYIESKQYHEMIMIEISDNEDYSMIIERYKNTNDYKYSYN